jgi:hypothetical protein
MIGLPRDCVSALARTRVTASVTDPAGNGATSVTGRDGKSPVWAKDADMAAESSSTTPAVMGNLRLSIYLSPADFDVVVSSKVRLIAPDYKSNELKDCSIFYMHLFFL